MEAYYILWEGYILENLIGFSSLIIHTNFYHWNKCKERAHVLDTVSACSFALLLLFTSSAVISNVAQWTCSSCPLGIS